MNTVKIKRLNKLAKIPTRGTAESAGYDLYAATDKDIQIPPHSNVKIGTGIAISIPNGLFTMIQLKPKQFRGAKESPNLL